MKTEKSLSGNRQMPPPVIIVLIVVGMFAVATFGQVCLFHFQKPVLLKFLLHVLPKNTKWWFLLNADQTGNYGEVLPKIDFILFAIGSACLVIIGNWISRWRNFNLLPLLVFYILGFGFMNLFLLVSTTWHKIGG